MDEFATPMCSVENLTVFGPGKQNNIIVDKVRKNEKFADCLLNYYFYILYNYYAMNVKNGLMREIRKKNILSKDELFKLINKHYESVSRSYFYQIVFMLIKNEVLTKIDSNTYTTDKKKYFSYLLTDDSIENIVKDYGDYTLWDTNIFNKWMNHLLNSVITFVEVDKELMYLVAGDLKKAGYNHILINPNVNEFFKYFDDHAIVVKPSVKSLVEKDHRISIERLIVELYSNKITNSLYGDTELVKMLNEIFKTYSVDLNKVFHIAKRKKIYDTLHSYLLKSVDRRYMYHD